MSSSESDNECAAMSDSESENEYAALLRKNLERKQALLAELGLDDFLNEGKRWFPEIKERDKPRRTVRTKSVIKERPARRSIRIQKQSSVIEERPARRSIRIQKQSHTMKYVKGFLGFDNSDAQCQELLDDNQQSVESTNAFSVQGSNNRDLANGQGDQNKGENEDPKNESDVHIGKVAIDQNASLEVVENKNKAFHDKEIEADMYDTLNKNCEFVPGELGVHVTASIVKISDTSLKVKDNSVPKEKFMETAEKKCIMNNNNNDLSDYIEDYQNIDWNDRSEEICKQIILKHSQGSVQLKKHDNEDTDSEDDWSKYKNVMFCVSASENSEDSDVNYSNDDKIPRSRRRVSYPKVCYDVPSVSCEDVTEEMLANIAKRSSSKVYDQFKGTTCHQCRQKTFDTKTVCRSGKCVGVRGMFCGICLPKRYGEQVADALKNPDWECPVCRGICNCSFCRARAGKIPTGILYPEARQLGYNCVAEYLKDKDDKENISTKEKKLKVLKY